MFNESEKGENPSPRLSLQLDTSENFGGEPCPELETSKSSGDKLWDRPLHMNPVDNSKEEDISKESPPFYPKQ